MMILNMMLALVVSLTLVVTVTVKVIRDFSPRILILFCGEAVMVVES